MALADDHLNLLVLACEHCIGMDFDRLPAAQWRRRLERTGDAEVDEQFQGHFRPRVLGVRMGLGERTGMSLARELQRHDLVRRWCGEDMWKVTIDGARKAAVVKRKRPVEARPDTTSDRAVTRADWEASVTATCGRCGHRDARSGAKYCAICGCPVGDAARQMPFNLKLAIAVLAALLLGVLVFLKP